LFVDFAVSIADDRDGTATASRVEPRITIRVSGFHPANLFHPENLIRKI
jgi:hypothetical protein